MIDELSLASEGSIVSKRTGVGAKAFSLNDTPIHRGELDWIDCRPRFGTVEHKR